MCETRNELKSIRTTYKSVGQEDGGDVPRPVSRQPSSVRQPSSSPRVPRATRPPVEKRAPAQSDGEWTAVVSRKSSTSKPSTKPTNGKPKETKR
jgi:hypothetical protein